MLAIWLFAVSVIIVLHGSDVLHLPETPFSVVAGSSVVPVAELFAFLLMRRLPKRTGSGRASTDSSEARHEAVLTILEERGIGASPGLLAHLAALGELLGETAVRAALRCSSEGEFRELCAAVHRENRAGHD